MQRLLRSSFLTTAMVMVLAVFLAIAISFVYGLSVAQAPMAMPPAPTRTTSPLEASPYSPEELAQQPQRYIIIDSTPVAIAPDATHVPGAVYIEDHPIFGLSLGNEITGTLEDIDLFSPLIGHEVFDAMQAERRAQNAIADMFYGPEHAGEMAGINGKRVQMPEGFYVAQKSIGITCDLSAPTYCPQAPITLITNIATGNSLAIDATNHPYNGDVSDEEEAAIIAEFESLLRQIDADQ